MTSSRGRVRKVISTVKFVTKMFPSSIKVHLTLRGILKENPYAANCVSKNRLSFKSTAHAVHEQVTAAEVRNTVMFAHHNASLCLADHIGPMQCKNFPDSEIVKNYHCTQTKTACILSYAIAPRL